LAARHNSWRRKIKSEISTILKPSTADAVLFELNVVQDVRRLISSPEGGAGSGVQSPPTPVEGGGEKSVYLRPFLDKLRRIGQQKKFFQTA